MKEISKAMRKQHRILIATDGSPSAQGALGTAVKFPWPASSSVRVVIARSSWLPDNSEHSRAVVKRSFDAAAAAARRALRRWPAPEVVVSDAAPADAILTQAERFDASVIVLGWRGHGTFRRLLAGSVSRTVAAQAQRPVLVVREAVNAVRRFVIGFDGSPNAERAIDFVSSLEPRHGCRVMLVNVVDRAVVPASIGRFPSSMRALVHGEVAALNKKRQQEGHAIVVAAASRLEQAGWPVKSEVRVGAPLASLLKAVEEHRADVLILGARATSGIERALLGSVANGALNRAPVLLLVR